jgi:hypothetical protein
LRGFPQGSDVAVDFVRRPKIVIVTTFVRPFVRFAEGNPNQARFFRLHILHGGMEKKGVEIHIRPERSRITEKLFDELEAGTDQKE